jgi:lipopolysaccharide export system protein LptA
LSEAKFFLSFFFALTALALAVSASFAEIPDDAQITADRMRFDSQSGDFLASGNVVIQAGGLTAYAPRGTGNINNKEVHFTEGVLVSGDWQGDWVDLSSWTASIFFAQTPTYIAEGDVKGEFGKIWIDADKLYMKGENISALNVRRLVDREKDVTFGGQDVRGILRNGVLSSMTAQRAVWLRGRPNSEGEMVNIQGDTAVYSVERGSVVISGSVKAVQKGRTITSRSLVYFPDTNRFEAAGGIAEGRGTPARITIDINQERQKR